MQAGCGGSWSYAHLHILWPLLYSSNTLGSLYESRGIAVATMPKVLMSRESHRIAVVDAVMAVQPLVGIELWGEHSKEPHGRGSSSLSSSSISSAILLASKQDFWIRAH